MNNDGFDATDYDRYCQLADNVSLVQERKRTVGLFDWVRHTPSVGHYGVVLSPILLFVPQSNIFCCLV
jgi:hypothetical protein